MKKIFLYAVCALALTACDTTDDSPVNSSNSLEISASIRASDMTRAGDTSWNKNDNIGITAIVGTLDDPRLQPHVNIKYTTQDGSNKFTGSDIYYYNNMLLTAYYPYTGTEGTAPGIISANTRIENQDAAKQPSIDFLYADKTGIKAANPTVDLAFSHQMSKITITLINGDNTVNVANVVEYRITGLVMDGTFNTSTGECAADPKAASELISKSYNKGEVKDGEPLRSLIMFPQKTPDPVTLEIDMDEVGNGSEIDYQHYGCTLKFGEEELKSGHHYKFKIYVTKKGLIMGELSINDWTTGQTLSLIATIDGDAPFEKE